MIIVKVAGALVNIGGSFAVDLVPNDVQTENCWVEYFDDPRYPAAHS